MFKGCTEFYGNNTVYITDGDRVQKFEKHNYLVQHLENDGDDIWIASGVIVALGACCNKADAAEQLRRVLQEMEQEVEAECANAGGCLNESTA